jgi:iron complex transport system ATP-binding protein
MGKPQGDAMNEIALRAVNMSASLSKCLILSDLNVDFSKGRWISIVGPNGAGKSTLLKALAGLLSYQGQVLLHGKEIRSLPPRERAQQLAWLAQDETGALDMRVQDVVMLGRLPMLGLLGGITAQDTAACEQAMQQTQTTVFAQRLLGELSAGQQQRVRLARALATQAKVLLLDEPLANLDPPHQMDWLHAIRAQVESGVTVISVLHELPIALLSDDMLILREGGVAHYGACLDTATHRAIEAVFDQRVRVLEIDGMWTVLPREGLNKSSG